MARGVPHSAISPLFLVFSLAPASIVASDRSTADLAECMSTQVALVAPLGYQSGRFRLPFIYKS